MVGDQIIQWLKDHKNDAEEPRQSPPTMCHLLADVYKRVEGYDKTIIANAINVIACMDAGFDKWEKYQFQPIDYSQSESGQAPFDGDEYLLKMCDGYVGGAFVLGTWMAGISDAWYTVFGVIPKENVCEWMHTPEFMKE